MERGVTLVKLLFQLRQFLEGASGRGVCTVTS